MEFSIVLLFVTAATLQLIGAEELEDTCICNCCFDTAGSRQCVQNAATTFMIGSCEFCQAATCAHRFSRSCGLKDATISADCVERTAWYLRFIPVAFLVATVALVFYGLFIKTFDGYHPLPSSDDENPVAPLSEQFRPVPYGSTSQIPVEARGPYAVKQPSPLSRTAPLMAAAKFSGDFPQTDATSPSVDEKQAVPKVPQEPNDHER